MNKYGQAALISIQLVKAAKTENPIEAWTYATAQVFKESISARKKGCPKGAFLGLCEEGLVKGINKGSYTKSVANKQYAIEAVGILRTSEEKSMTPAELWNSVMKGKVKKHNSQMNVVLILWNEGLI